ncbi:MAG: penicillin-binding protein 2 [Verrucomicrobiaceae bacterium]|nr:penicillin-binding protein 2 [Verrucomicrobiaceae bacterium]
MVVKYRFRLYLFSLVVMGAFATLIYRLHYLQIERHDEFVTRIPGAKLLKSRVPPVRGEIKDCNGIVLASNRPTFEVRINLKEVVDAKIQELKIASGGKDVVLPKINVKYMDGGFERIKKETDIVTLMEEKVFRPLREMHLAKDDYDPDQLRIHFRTFAGTVPWVYRSDLSFEEFSRFAEHNLQLPGVVPEVRPVRQYLFDALACHLMGYVRLPDESLVPKEERAAWDFYVGDDFGYSGVEKTMDAILRGEAGARVWLKDEKGRIVREETDKYVAPKKGNDVWLTIDARMQVIAERALRDAKLGRAAIVMLDVNSGEVKAMASVPSYNPNKFIPTISLQDFDNYRLNPTTPWLNRAIKPYAPGSTFKITTAFAGVLAKIQNQYFPCNGSVTYGNKAMQCWIQRQFGGSHGSLNLSDAIMRSCNCFFYQYGNAAGIESMGKAGRMLGVGEKTGIELEDEDPGVLPTREWFQLHQPNENWKSPGLLANTSIGQGFVLATPLQMCSVAATVANGGKSYKPHLLKRVMAGTQLVSEHAPELRSDLEAEGISSKNIELIRNGMWKVVNGSNGTGKAAQIPELPGVEVAGKTGTAQFWRKVKGEKTPDNHTWFISFAPYNQPRFAVCVLIQGGKSGGGCAAPVAKRVLSQSLALDQGYQVAIAPISEVEGSFQPIESVVYQDDAAMAKVASLGDDNDTGAQAGERESQDVTVQDRKVADESMIRRERRAAESQRESAPQPASQPQPQPERRGLLRKLFGR